MGVLGRERLLHPFALASAHAVLFALAFPPFDLWVLALASLAPLGLMAVSPASTRRIVLITFITQFLMWMWLVRWIIPVTAVGYPFLALYMSIWPTLAVWIMRRVSRHPVLGRWPMTLVLPVIWVGVECFRGDVLFHGYPWYLLGHPLIAVPAVVQSADLFGTYFISFLVAMMSGFIVDLYRSRFRKHTSKRTSFRFAVLSMIVVLALNAAYGIWRLNQTATLIAGPRILALQTNLPQDNKKVWSLQGQVDDFIRFAEQTLAYAGELRAAGTDFDLFLWPETMLPGFGLEPQAVEFLATHEYHARDYFALAIAELQRQVGVPMIIGSECWIDLDVVNERFTATRKYNSAYLIKGDPPYQRYDKFFLTPFGETMPYISAWPWLERQFLTLGVGADMAFNLDSNPDIAILTVSGAGPEQSEVRIAAPICFEDSVARYCRRMVYHSGGKRVDLIVNISNDGWFGTADADRQLHAMTARFRAIENRVPVVRCVNTGLSLSIDSCGRIVGSIGSGTYGAARQEGRLLAEPRLDSRSTLYGRIGESWPAACLLAAIFGLGWTVVRNGKSMDS